jgi:hypothetical protein
MLDRFMLILLSSGGHPMGAARVTVQDETAQQLVKRFPALFPDVRIFHFKTYEVYVAPKAPRFRPFRKKHPLSVNILAMPPRKLIWHASPEILVSRMLRDVDFDESILGIPVLSNEFDAGLTRLLADTERNKEGLALYSNCWTHSDASVHIPMLDFSIECRHGRRALDLVLYALVQMGQKDGAVLKSGKSYHYYGFRLMTDHEWRRFMVKSVLIGQLSDIRYIGHRLLAGKAALRLNRAPGKDNEPTVIAEFGNGETLWRADDQL